MFNQSGKLAIIFLITALILVVVLLTAPLLNRKEVPLASPQPSPQNQQVSYDCQKDPRVYEGKAWDLLPEEVGNLTYKKGVRMAAESTYEIYLLTWSDDCRYLPFLVELIGRGGGAYTREDYKYRSIFILDDQEGDIFKVVDIPAELLLDTNVYGSDLWEEHSYKFVLSETEKNGRFVKIRYVYSVNSGMLEKGVEQN